MKKNFNQSTLIIAEAGINHNGDLNRAFKMIHKAKEIGVDIIKFQTFIPESLVTINANKAKYQNLKKNDIETQLQLISKYNLSFSEFKLIKKECKKKNIGFLSSPFDIKSAEFLISLKVKLVKIASGEITNYPLLKYLGKQKKSLILSTGMSSLEEIESAIKVLTKFGTPRDKISLLHCNTSYPTPLEDVNLNAIKILKNKFLCNVGYSDHTEGIEISLGAVAMGAAIIEKHVTLSKKLPGPDHKASIDFNEFKQMIIQIRNIEKALGIKKKIITKSERVNMGVARKSIVALTNIYKGDIFSELNITTKRPGKGISPMKWEKILGKKATKNFKPDEYIKL